MSTTKTQKKSASTVSTSLQHISHSTHLTHNALLVVGNSDSPLEVIFPKSDYDVGASRRLTFGVTGQTSDFLLSSAAANPDLKFPLTTFQGPYGPILQLTTKALMAECCSVHVGDTSTMLSEYDLKRGDKVQLILKPYEYKGTKGGPSGISLQVWAIKILEVAPPDVDKIVVPPRLFSASDFM